MKLTEELGREPTDAEIAAQLAFSERTVAGLRRSELKTISLQDQIQQGEEGEFQDIIPDRHAMTPDQIIGDIYLKHIDTVKNSCEMGIHLANDTYKGKGYGTQAERFILHYAFHQLHMDVVYADTRTENERSRHTLEKAGFTQTGRANGVCRFECRKSSWNGADLLDSYIIA